MLHYKRDSILLYAASPTTVRCLVHKDGGLHGAKLVVEDVEKLDGILDIDAAACLANAVHAQLWVSDVDGAHAELGGESRADGASAEGVVANHKQLQRDAGDASAFLEKDDAGRVGGVLVVGVDLDDGAAVHGRAVRRLVLLGVVGVHGVGHVGRHQEGSRQRLLKGGVVGADVLVAAGRRRDDGHAAKDGGDQVGACALGGLGANLFVIEADHHADRVIVLEAVGSGHGLNEGLERAVRHFEVVEAGRHDKLVIDAAEARLLRVVEHQLKVDNRRNIGAGVLGNELEDGRVVARRHGRQRILGGGRQGGLVGRLVELGLGQVEDGEELRLLVGVKVGLTVEVDGEVGDAEDGLVNLDQLLHDVATLANKDAAGDTQIAIEPRVPDAAAVRLDADLVVAEVGLFRDGLDAQAGRVGVGANDGNGVAGLPLLADGEGNNGRGVAGKVVFTAGLDGGCPRVLFADQLEAGLFEASAGRVDGVEGYTTKVLADAGADGM